MVTNRNKRGSHRATQEKRQLLSSLIFDRWIAVPLWFFVVSRRVSLWFPIAHFRSRGNAGVSDFRSLEKRSHFAPYKYSVGSFSKVVKDTSEDKKGSATEMAGEAVAAG